MNRAKQLRLDSGMGIMDTADGASVSTRTLKKIEAGEDVHVHALARLATFYGVQPSELLQPAVFPTASEGEAA